MARLLFARGASGEIVRKIQRALMFAPKDVDGVYGKDTEKALTRFQTANSLDATGTMDVSTWTKLMLTPVPPVRERSLQLTGAFEGHGFTLAQGNFDGAGITWGIIGFTLIGGELGKFFKEINQENPALIAQAFQGSAKQLMDVFRAPKATQLAFADSVSLGASKGKLAEPWRSAFQRFGEMAEVQAHQLELADRDYFQPALQTAREFGLQTELGISLCFDVHVQNGSINAKARAAIKQELQDHPIANEQELRVIIANSVADNARAFQEDVRSRKLTIATGTGSVHGQTFVLRNWGLDESAFSA